MKNTLTALAFSLCLLTGTAQTATDSTALRALYIGRVLQQERVYLHFDNTSYYLGETMWFKAFVTWYSDDSPTELSRVLYVELVSPEGYVVKTNKYKIGEDGTCHGDIYLDPLYLSGYYEIRAYTRYMLNWGDEAVFSRVFPVFDKVNNGDWGFRNIRERDKGFFANKALKKEKEPELKFYPESGHLLNGVESKVAYELTGAKGAELHEDITILADGKPLLVTTPEHMGKGFFMLTPQQNTSYTAKVTLSDEKGKRKTMHFKLPKTEAEGVTVAVSELQDSIRFSIKGSAGYGDLGFCILHGSDLGSFMKTIGNDTTFHIAKNNLSEGVSRAVVFRGNIPLAERMFFVQHDEIEADDKGTVKLNVTGNGYMLHNLEAKPHEKISIEVAREDGKPLDENVAFTFSVTDQAGTLTTSWGYNLHTYMLLGSEVKGYIPDAYQYFNPENSRRKEHLDLVMLTNGWTAYSWEKLTARSFNGVVAPEEGLTVSGQFAMRVKERKSEQMYRVHNRPYNQVRIDYNGGDNFIKTQVFRTDRYGKFNIILDDFYGRETVALSPNTIFKHSENVNYAFFMDKYFSPKPKPFSYWQCNVGSSIRSQFEKDTISGMAKVGFNEYLIESVDITADYNRKITRTQPISEMRFDYLDEWEYAMDITYKDGVVDRGGSFDYEHQEIETWLQKTLYEDRTGGGGEGGSEEMLSMEEAFNWRKDTNREMLVAYTDVLTVMNVVRSIYQRYNLGWQNWVQPVVVKGEYDKDSIPVADEKHLHGIDVEKMTNFREIIITSDRKKTESVQGGYGVWQRRSTVYANKGKHAFFYDGFLIQNDIKYPLDENSRIYNTDITSDLHILSTRVNKNAKVYMEHPNQVAYLIPDTSDNKSRIQNDLSVSSSTRRYTSLRGYNESKQFYSPDYSDELPDEKDYRRTLFWCPEVKPVDGKLNVSIYNSSVCNAINVDVLGYHDNTIYSTDNGFVTRENYVPWTKKRPEKEEEDMLMDSAVWARCDADFEKAEIYYNKRNFKKALTTYIELVQYNYPKAFYKIGLSYLKGIALKKRTDLAAQFFERGAELGMAECYFELSQMYRDGIHFVQDKEKEVEMLMTASDLLEPRAMVRLARYCKSGNGVEKDTVEALRLFRDAALAGNNDALYEYGVYLYDNDMTDDTLFGSGFDCIAHAAMKRHIMAMQWMYGYHAGKEDWVKAYEYAREMYIEGDTRAAYHLAGCYLDGKGVRRDKRLAKDLYREAAAKGVKEAEKVLGEWNRKK